MALLAGQARAALVFEVAEDGSQWIVTHEPRRRWGIGDPVVVVKDQAVLAMGVVEASNEVAALVTVRRQGRTAVAKGDEALYGRETSQVFEVLQKGLEFWANHPITRHWSVSDPVCVIRHKLNVGCGTVVEALPDRARIRLAGAVSWAAAGDYVRPAFHETPVVLVDRSRRALQVRQGVFEKWETGEVGCLRAGTGALCGQVVDTNELGALLATGDSVDGVEVGTPVRGFPRTAYVYQVAADQSMLVATHHLGRHWKDGDRVCAQREGYEIACGRVIQSNDLAALVTLETRSRFPVVTGDSVRRVGTGDPEVMTASLPAVGPVRDPALESTLTEASAGPSFGNLLVGLNYVFPTARYEQALFGGLALGVTGLYLQHPSEGGKLVGHGAGLALSYYDGEWFEGLWIQAGASLLRLDVSSGGVTDRVETPMGSATLGWRWRWESGINLGFAVGLNYLAKTSTPIVPLDSAMLLPAIALDLGLAF